MCDEQKLYSDDYITIGQLNKLKGVNMKTLQQISEEYPTLNTNGFGYYCSYSNKYISSDDITKYPKEFKAIRHFLNNNVAHIKTVSTNGGSSYGLKHIVEGNIHHYISNGMFIAASLACGYKMKYKDSYGPNAFFAMSQKDWNRLQETKGKSGPRLDKH